MILFAVDPGKNNGWAKFLVNQEMKTLKLLGTGTDQPEPFRSLLVSMMQEVSYVIPGEHLFVVEDFLNRPQKTRTGAFDWNENLTSQMIGSLQLAADFLGAPLVKQQPNLKVPGYGFLGKQFQKGKSGMHQMDAMAHAAYYLVTKLGFRPPDLTNS